MLQKNSATNVERACWRMERACIERELLEHKSLRYLAPRYFAPQLYSIQNAQTVWCLY